VSHWEVWLRWCLPCLTTGARRNPIHRARIGRVKEMGEWPTEMMTIEFSSGVRKRIKADSGEVRDGVLISLVYSNDGSSLRENASYPVKTVEWARLDNGTVLVGDPKRRFMD